jgi:anaerobic selenocysteine-containing dehydrogenase
MLRGDASPAVLEVRGCCPLDCQDTCSWVAEVADGRVVAVRGAKDHPFTRGALCAKVNDYERRVYAPDRLLHRTARSCVAWRRARASIIRPCGRPTRRSRLRRFPKESR